MTTEPSNTGAPGGASNIVERAKNIIMTPRAEWDRIAAEPANTNAILMGYVLPLTALAAVAGIIGGVVFGYGWGPFRVSVGLVPALVGGVVRVVLSVVWVYVLGLIIDALAPNFGSQKDPGKALQLAAYSGTAGYLAGLFAIYPPLAMLGILGLYSVVLLYIGAPRLMKTPEDKRVGYVATIIVVAIVVGIVAAVIMGAVTGAVGGAAGGFGRMGGMHFGSASSSAPDNVKISVNGATIDVGGMEKAAKQMEQAYKQGAADGGATAAIDPNTLLAAIPSTIGDFKSATESSDSGGAMGMNVAHAERTLRVGDEGGPELKIELTHGGVTSGLAAMANAMGVQGTHREGGNTETVRNESGRTITEKVDTDSGTVELGVILRNGLIVAIDGRNGATIDQARAALAALHVDQLEAASAASN